MNKRLDAGLLGQLGQRPRNGGVHLFERIVDSAQRAVAAARRDNVLGFVVLSNHVDDNV